MVIAHVRAATRPLRWLLVPLAVLGLLPTGAAAAQDHVAAPQSPPEAFALLQMNLCLSGFAGCFGGTEYPKIVDEAITRIEELQPDAVTVNEACSGDVEDIAAATGYQVRFATVLFPTEPLACKDPAGRGQFGNAVLTAAPVLRSEDAAFTSQTGTEQRRWLCVETVEGVTICTAHLATRGGTTGPPTNDAQCAELSQVLRDNARRGPTLFGGDVNRDPSCAAPGRFWTFTDIDAPQLPGIQHAYGDRRSFRNRQVTIVPATYTDHDFMLVTTQLRGRR